MPKFAAFLLSTIVAASVHASSNANESTVFFAKPTLQQVAFTVNDLDRAVNFYRDTLGLPFLFETNGMAFFEIGSTRLMLGTDVNRPDVERPTAIIYFDTTDFNRTVDILLKRGVTFVAPIETVTKTEQGTLMLAEFRDPDGNALAVMGIVPDLSDSQ